jgi:hypothetical protein
MPITQQEKIASIARLLQFGWTEESIKDLDVTDEDIALARERNARQKELSLQADSQVSPDQNQSEMG